MKIGKIFFISLQKLFSFLRKSKFRILDIQVLRRHQMPKHKANHFTESFGKKTKSVKNFFASLKHITKEKILS